MLDVDTRVDTVADMAVDTVANMVVNLGQEIVQLFLVQQLTALELRDLTVLTLLLSG